MPDGQSRPLQSVETAAHVEQTISIGSRIHRKQDAPQKERKRKRRQAGIEKTLEEKREELDRQYSDEQGYVDYHA